MKRILLLGLFICNLLGLETIAQNITGSIISVTFWGWKQSHRTLQGA